MGCFLCFSIKDREMDFWEGQRDRDRDRQDRQHSGRHKLRFLQQTIVGRPETVSYKDTEDTGRETGNSNVGSLLVKLL